MMRAPAGRRRVLRAGALALPALSVLVWAAPAWAAMPASRPVLLTAAGDSQALGNGHATAAGDTPARDGGDGDGDAAVAPDGEAATAVGGDRLATATGAGFEAARWEQRSELGAEAFGFARRGAQGQDAVSGALSWRSEFWTRWNEGRDVITVVPFIRLDSADRERHRIDLRQLEWVHARRDGLELRAGIRQVFWGVTEGAHLVDILNQTDQAAALDGEQKLGQPMLSVGGERGAHQLEGLLLAGARARPYAGADGRLRLPLVVDADLAGFESRRGRDRFDGALRYQFNDGGLRLALSGFSGSAREPALRPVVDPSRLVYAGPQPVGLQPGYQPVLAPFYPLIDQLGLEAQYTHGDTLWKLEAIERHGQGPRFRALDAGLERTQVGLAGSRVDVGWLLEYLHDSRGHAATTPFADDVLAGARLAFNDVAGSELLASVMVDRDTQEQLWSLEGSRRLGECCRLALEARVFAHTPPAQDAWAFLAAPDTARRLRPLAQDDYLRLGWTRFF